MAQVRDVPSHSRTGRPHRHPRSVAARVLIGSGALAFLVWPALGSALALLGGGAVAALGWNPDEERIQTLAKHALAASVVGLGAGFDFETLRGIGPEGLGIILATVTIALSLGWALARVLRVDATTGVLIAVGTAICGGSAIAAVGPTIRARPTELTVALATVFLLNAIALVAFPAMGHALGLDARDFGLWCAVAIHDTSSVVGAAMARGTEALEVATAAKLARASLIVPLTAGLALHARRIVPAGGDAPKAARPYFIAAFVALAVLVNLVPSLAPIGATVAALSRRALVATLFLVGASMGRDTLRAIGLRPMVQGAVLFVATSSLSLLAILALP